MDDHEQYSTENSFYDAVRSYSDRMWRWWYQRLAKAKGWGEFGFMNYGFIDNDPPKLSEDDEPDRLFIQLYHMNIRDVELTDKQVLEVGSGRGGGANWVARTYSPEQLTGLDYSPAAVKLCNNVYRQQENLNFIEGNAMKLPFDDHSFDVVYNVESSHCYSDMSQFVHEVHRVLKPGGYFAWTDFRDEETMHSIRKMFEKATFQTLADVDITAEVLAALDEISDLGDEISDMMKDPENYLKAFTLLKNPVFMCK